MKSIIFTAISIEKKYGGKNGDWLSTTVFRQTGNEKIYQKMLKIIELDDEKKRYEELKKIEAPGYIGKKRVADRLIWLACLLQLFISLGLHFFCNSSAPAP